jgi:hypothetical protein
MNNCLWVLLFGMINLQATIYEQKCLVPPEEQAIKLVQCLFEQICEDKPISKADAAKYFGYHGGILEEILHETLANAEPAKHKGYEKDAQAYSPLGLFKRNNFKCVRTVESKCKKSFNATRKAYGVEYHV